MFEGEEKTEIILGLLLIIIYVMGFIPLWLFGVALGLILSNPLWTYFKKVYLK